jgi:hypothetical protein
VAKSDNTTLDALQAVVAKVSAAKPVVKVLEVPKIVQVAKVSTKTAKIAKIVAKYKAKIAPVPTKKTKKPISYKLFLERATKFYKNRQETVPVSLLQPTVNPFKRTKVLLRTEKSQRRKFKT